MVTSATKTLAEFGKEFTSPAPAVISTVAPMVVPSAVPVSPPPATPVAGSAVVEQAAPVPEGLLEMTTPFVGTYYSAPNPDTPAFVKVGSKVSKGQVMCIVEAMKLMNEIEAEWDGEVVEILAKNAQPVEFGEILFRIRPV